MGSSARRAGGRGRTSRCIVIDRGNTIRSAGGLPGAAKSEEGDLTTLIAFALLIC
jgi:hypothetical protein